MHAALWLLAVATPGTAIPGPGDEPPAEVEAFVPEGFSVLDYAAGDLDGDRRADAVLILKDDAEEDARLPAQGRPGEAVPGAGPLNRHSLGSVSVFCAWYLPFLSA
jgi:hypothetical protein